MHSSKQVCMLQVGPAHPLSQMQFWSLSQCPWKLHFVEQSLDTLQKKVQTNTKNYCQQKKIGRGWVAKHSKCWACNRSPYPTQNPSWVCFSLALTQILTGVHLTTILHVLYYYIVYLNLFYYYCYYYHYYHYYHYYYYLLYFTL